MTGIVGLIISIAMAAWVYQVVNKHGGKLPWLWAIGALVFWPLVATLTGSRYDETAIMVVGMTGLCLVVVGLVVVLSLVPIMFQLPHLAGVGDVTTGAGVEAEEMMYFEWIMAALGVIVVYMLLGYSWVWWTTREGKPKK